MAAVFFPAIALVPTSEIADDSFAPLKGHSFSD